MYIIELASGVKHEAIITGVGSADFKRINVKRYVFNWRPLAKSCELFKLTKTGSDDILGLMGLIEHAEEQRIEIKLLTASVENIGKAKQFDRIAGCLIAFAANEALERFDDYPAISLLPKTSIKQHYIQRYRMQDAGKQLYLEDMGLIDLINEYLK